MNKENNIIVLNPRNWLVRKQHIVILVQYEKSVCKMAHHFDRYQVRMPLKLDVQGLEIADEADINNIHVINS